MNPSPFVTVLLVISSVAVSHGLFWATVLIGLNQKLSNRLLACLLIMISLRVGKSTVGMLMPEYQIFFSGVGVVSMSAIGPLLLFCAHSLFDSNYKLKLREWLHFVPSIILMIALLIKQYYINGAYTVFTASVLIYMIATLIFLWTNRETFRADDMKWTWIMFIIGAIAVLWITFVCQLLFYRPLVYQSIVITAALLFYSLSWYAIPRSRLFIAEPQKKLSDAQTYQVLGSRIQKLLEEEEVFINTDLTVSTLATKLKCPAYMVSRAINQYFNKSFSELIVEFRIKKAEQLLLADSQRSLTIEAIAFESGFNTLSAFYKSFKKINGITPSQYREKELRVKS
ncbi:MAG TPA: helix-turn-helix domain-containing protein [Cyclobacteriaceae bacterium]|nr:helix-turn-helix domain-containing protein [Cyclobacteriaceae bacterium]